jgi:predicted ABC-type transport system involved in lysophospholipase L1 biosynthesis ATPase subunit
MDALHEHFGFAQVTATHDADVAARYDRTVALADGRIVSSEQAA